MTNVRTLWTKLLIPLIVLSTTSQAVATWRDGNQLHQECQKDIQAFAYGFLFGLLDGYEIGQQEGATGHFCIPEQASGKQLMDVMCRYIDAHPESRHGPASYMAYLAFKEAWPCSN